MTLLKKTFFLLSALFILSTPLLTFAAGPYYGLDEAANQAGLDSTKEAPTLIGNVIGSILALIGVIFFVLMVYGGFLWMTAHGDSGQVDKGRETIIAAVIGIIIVVASYALTAFIMTAPTGGADTKPPLTPQQETQNEVNDIIDPNSVCKQRGGDGYDCRDLATCDPLEKLPGICPGGNNNVCCKLKP
jgi:hypothetical protein